MVGSRMHEHNAHNFSDVYVARVVVQHIRSRPCLVQGVHTYDLGHAWFRVYMTSLVLRWRHAGVHHVQHDPQNGMPAAVGDVLYGEKWVHTC